jgi:hypothetical protein
MRYHEIVESIDTSLFQTGYCHALALALHRLTGLPMVALEAREGRRWAIIHVMVETQPDHYLDSEGERGIDDILFDAQIDPDETTVRLAPISEADIPRLTRRGLEPISPETMRMAEKAARTILRDSLEESVLLELLDTSFKKAPRKVNSILANLMIGDSKYGGPISDAYTMKIGEETFMFHFGKRESGYTYAFGVLDKKNRDIYYDLTRAYTNQFQVLAAATQILLLFLKDKHPVSVYFFGNSKRHATFYSRAVSHLRTIVPKPYRVIDLKEWEAGIVVTRLPRKNEMNLVNRIRFGRTTDVEYLDSLDRFERDETKNELVKSDDRPQR